MSCYRIRTWPDPALRRPARRLTDLELTEARDPDSTIARIGRRLAATMHAHHGVGIAAPQVGIGLAMCVVHPPGRRARVLLNPELVHAGVEHVDGEGCLSLPGHPARVTRWSWVRVTAVDPTVRAEAIDIEAEGLEARILQHELDHLDGRLIVHHVLDDDRPGYLNRLRCALTGLPDDDVLPLLARAAGTGPAETTTKPRPDTATRPAPRPPAPPPNPRKDAA